MLARSGKVSMATKKRSGEEINDRQILCGMGIKLRRLTAGICLITQLAFPMAVAAQGVVNAATQQPVPAQIAIANANTVPYTLGALESAQSVAERFGISVAELRKNSTSFVRLLEVLIMSARVMNWMSRHKLVKKKINPAAG